MLETEQDSQLRSRLEFSIDLDTLDSTYALPAIPQPQTRSRRRTLRRMLYSRSLRRQYKSNCLSNHQEESKQSKSPKPFQIQQLKLPSPIASFNSIIYSHNSIESDDDKGGVPDKANTKTHSSEQTPQRDSSLMFKPLLDATAVGSIFDIDQNEPAKPPKEPRIISSIRRVARTRTLAIQKHKRRLMKSRDIRPIDTEQDDGGFQINISAIKPQQHHMEPEHQPIAKSLAGAKEFLLNTPLGEFEIERTLGQGSYGKVKLMRSALTGEQFAVKIIRRLRARTDPRKAKTLDRRVVREANLAAILGQLHPHIVPLHDLRATDTHFYLFYAFVEGPTLAERVGAYGMDESEARDIFKSVAETIQFCHQYSIIHRDIKLENVLLDGSCAMLIDFGLANFYGGALMETFCGSLPYTAPEILRGTAYTGPEVDVWSLGVLLYVMLTGHFPFDDPAQPANYDRIMAGDFPRRSALGHRVLDLLTRMLEPDSAKRIQLPDVLSHIWLADKPPGVCCSLHGSSIHQPTSVHSHRTLVLPGPCASTLVAREVATCLDRPLSYVVDHIDKALAQGKPTEPTTSNSCGNLLAPIEHWPISLHSLCQGPLLKVPNSPIVSVYALVLQQIGLRRYFMDLPPLEPQLSSTTRSSSSRLESSNSRSLRSRLLGTAKLQHGIRNLNDSSIVSPAYLQPLSTPELALRTISGIDHVHERITLPNELTVSSPLHVLAQLVTLLNMHQIAYKFVETQTMPAHQAMLNSSMFSLANLAITSSTDALAQPKPPLQSRLSAKNSVRSLISKLSKAPHHSTPMLVEQKQQRPRIVHPHLHDEYSATVPVKHPTAVMLAQYSPSLHRNRETEVVEYYSCSVRMELVRISNSINLRSPRYALLIERIAGHRGKFVLFKLFLHRIVAALPDIQPDPI